MDEVLSHDLGKINGDFENNDSDIDQEEEENRQREVCAGSMCYNLNMIIFHYRFKVC